VHAERGAVDHAGHDDRTFVGGVVAVRCGELERRRLCVAADRQRSAQLAADKRPHAERLRELYLVALSREPTPQELEPYELLLADAMKGDAFRFARMDYVNEAWRIVDPVLNSAGPLYEYDPGTWGPAEAKALVDEYGWHNPNVKALRAA